MQPKPVDVPLSWEIDAKPAQNPLPKIDFLKENFSENFTIIARQPFSKVWTFRNSSDKQFEAGALKLCFESGHQFSLENGEIMAEKIVYKHPIRPNTPF